MSMQKYIARWNGKSLTDLELIENTVQANPKLTKHQKGHQMAAVRKLKGDVAAAQEGIKLQAVGESSEPDQASYLVDDLSIAEKYIAKAKNSLDRGIVFTLSFAEYKRIVSRKTCYYTGVKFAENHRHYLTIDRVDSSKGYVSGNCVACTYSANAIKNELFEHESSVKLITLDQMRRMVEVLTHRQGA